MDKAKLIKSNKGYILENNIFKKMTVPDRNSHLPDGLENHQVKILKVIFDTKPENPRRGVIFAKVKHIRNECSECERIKREEEVIKKRKIKMETLFKELPILEDLYKNNEKNILIPGRASFVLSGFNKEEILIHKNWWKKCYNYVNRLIEINKKMDFIFNEIYKKYEERINKSWTMMSEIKEKTRMLYDELSCKCNREVNYEFTKDGVRYKKEIVFRSSFKKEDFLLKSYLHKREYGKIYVDESDDGYRKGGFYVNGYKWVEQKELDPYETNKEWCENTIKEFEFNKKKMLSQWELESIKEKEYKDLRNKLDKEVYNNTKCLREERIKILRELIETSPYGEDQINNKLVWREIYK